MKARKEQFSWKGINLNELREQMDDPADSAVLSLYNSSSMSNLRSLLEGMAKNDSAVPAVLPEVMRSFVTSELAFEFSDEDIRMFKQASEVWKKYGPDFCLILFFRSLPYTYMAEKPANVLRITKLLISQPERRIIETAQFIFDVMDGHWWEPDKQGILIALKVRLMHAAMRHLILEDKDNPWDHTWGKPISQEDLVATNQTFSLEIIKGLPVLGHELSRSDQEAWFHTWKRIGKIMGVKDELICSNMDEAWSLQHAVYNHLFRDESHSGILLCKALVETMKKFLMSERQILHMMKKMLKDDDYPDCFYKMLEPTYGKDHPDMFEMPAGENARQEYNSRLNADHVNHLHEYHKRLQAHSERTQDESLKKHTSLLGGLLGRLKEKGEDFVLQELMSKVGKTVIAQLSKHYRPGKDAMFRIPVDLKEHWEIT
ncbi:MAG: DUF2236 domain-containing protein [Bacteroidia bacterium]